jgi:hypothetical protein
MEAVIQTKRAGRNRQLTERDRELCGFLAVCRYLTREQIERLMFPGRSKARSSTRLRQLARRIGSQEALLRGDLGYGSAQGWTTVWALTAEGFEVGSQHMGLKLERVPKQDVGQAFFKHEAMANEVFLGLVPHDGKTWAKVPRSFRWVLGEYLDLPFEDYARMHGRLALEKRRLQPDAVLELPTLKKRFFIEYETGSATVRDAKKSTSTMAKLDRYGTFFRAPVGNVFGGGLAETAYTRAFSDGWSAEVLFVARTEARRDSITRVIAERERSDKSKFAARALTLEESHRALCRAVYGAEQPPGTAKHAARIVESSPAPTIWPTDAPARTASEERLRRGRVSVRGEQLITFEKLLRNSLDALSSALDVLTRMRLPTEMIPAILRAAPEPMRLLSEYARRGRETLSRHGLTAAE